ncbi:hypothetical protein CW304_24520 [Bacillus sp. UFRGS-B20]|nr:hypothetical protein CW304_24520 [Bacillus sp. UFRGS-B20]
MRPPTFPWTLYNFCLFTSYVMFFELLMVSITYSAISTLLSFKGFFCLNEIFSTATQISSSPIYSVRQFSSFRKFIVFY